MEKEMGKPCSCIEIVQKKDTRPNYITMAGCPIKRITEQFCFSDWNQDSDFHRQESVA